MKLFLSGAIVMGYAVAAVFFARFWRDTRDRLFLFFVLAFVTLAVQRTIVTFDSDGSLELWSYSLRLLAFVGIAIGIIDKNRSR